MANLDQIYGPDERTKAFENHERGTLVSLAGPGTGKTYSLLKRIEALTGRGVTSDSICYLTFIKEISKTFIQDYIDTFGSRSYETNRPRISTLHSFACRLIRNQGFRIGYDEELYFMNITDNKEDGSKVFLQDLHPLVKSHGLLTLSQLKKILEKIKIKWRNDANPSSFSNQTTSVLSTCLNLLRTYRLIDWDQTIPTAHNLFNQLQQKPDWISRIEHFLIDEYQDFNQAEQRFISAISAIAKSTVIVGDDNQSLYSSRGASPDGLKTLYNYHGCDRISLIRCRRCKSKIIEAANTFLNAMRPDPHLMLPFKDGGEVLCYYFKSTKAEVDYLKTFLSQRINELPENPKSSDGTICLFPTWKSLNFYFDQLSPHITCSKRKPASHILRSQLQLDLQLVCHPDQRFLERLILERYKCIKTHHKKKMVQRILQRDISPADAMDTMIRDGGLMDPAKSQALEFCRFCRALESKDTTLIAEQLSKPLDIDIKQLRQRLDDFLLCLDVTEPEDAISNLCDFLIPYSAQPQEEPRSILFLTMHGSKGLTKKTVVMPGLEESWLPGNTNNNDLDEKKRLFYVAFTRATDRILITYPRQRARREPLNYNTPGRGQACSFVNKCGLKFLYYP